LVCVVPPGRQDRVGVTVCCDLSGPRLWHNPDCKARSEKAEDQEKSTLLCSGYNICNLRQALLDMIDEVCSICCIGDCCAYFSMGYGYEPRLHLWKILHRFDDCSVT
jgi:hypothetical protein